MTTDNEPKCQMHGIPAMAAPVGRIGILRQMRKKIKRMAKRRWGYLQNLYRTWSSPRNAPAVAADPSVLAAPLRPGDVVRVRSESEIRSTLSNWNELKGCVMMEEMWRFCDTRHRVLKRVRRFLDERDYLMKQISGVVLLEEVNCKGTVDFGPCDRSCYFFWREEWLEKISEDVRENP